MADSKGLFPDDLRLKAGVSLSQTRFALSNFCLNNFGADGQYFADIIELCGDANLLQQALNSIRVEVRNRCPDRLPALAACVREANETDAATPAPLATAAPPTGRATPAPAPAVSPQRSALAPASPRSAEKDPLRLEPGVSLAQARFVLAEFCLDQFGMKGQQFVDRINRCVDLAGLQTILNGIGAEVRDHQGDSLPKLSGCVRQINETADPGAG
jgi:hypothetical protein